MLRGLYDTRTPMFLALVGYWLLGVPIGAFLAFGVQLQGVGIWLGFITGLTVVAILLILRWHRFGVSLQARMPYTTLFIIIVLVIVENYRVTPSLRHNTIWLKSSSASC